MVVIDGLSKLLGQIRKVGTGCASQIFWLIGLQKLLLDHIPILEVNIIIS
jgi:hypothetical protein